MSRKILLDEDCKSRIVEYIKTEHQCTVAMVCKKFDISRHVLYANLGKDFVFGLTFHGIRDETRDKIASTLTGRTQSEETKEKRRKSCKAYYRNEPIGHKETRIKKMMDTRISNAGSLENSYRKGAIKSKQTKLQRYSDCNYNNHEKNKETKKERYGDENYNNKERIRQTQFEKYGNYAFAVKEKYEKSMLEKYGVKHNWSSQDLHLNGWKTRLERFGSKENFYSYALAKG